MITLRGSTSRRSTTMRIAAGIPVLFLLASCNGDPLNTSGTTGNSQAPIITTSPTNVTVAAGQPASFTVTATGAPPLAFQWIRNGVDIPGATQSTYTLAAATVSDNGAIFSVRVSNPFGSVTSGTAVLTVQ